jgi:redox-sensitive bicupin YhaK (pirin superfamily)
MITLRRGKERHCVRCRKQEVWYTFYPQDQTDPLANGFGAVEVLNENRLRPGAGVASYPKQKAEIVTYVHEGALAQEDSTGRSGVVYAGEFQCMTNGRSVRHSERNASQA